ncbi:MAG: cobalamin B12-binding domain-containing protein [Elusimicrobia bacterium]|nr:cobalamin B12-binding domain-containing protein [Elusimicrobiota bacterium]
MEPRLLLTSVARPLGTAYGDAESVGYELLHAQVTRAQGMFSPRAVHKQFSLDYIAENLENPTVVLHYPSKEEFIRELKKGYDYVGISFIVVTYHKMKELARLVREHAPQSQIVLGGYGTVLPEEALAPYADHVCRGEGVAFMRGLLGQPPLARHKHPVTESRLKVFSQTVSYTGMIFAGLGCPNGCDFCSTSHFFKRQHLPLLETGAQVYAVVQEHLAINPAAQFTILDEEFLLDRRRALEFRDLVAAGGKALSIFVFASMKALSLYEPQELLAMGIDGVWIGYEGTRSGYDKRVGRSPEEIFRGLHDNGITILASMIVGFDYQSPAVIDSELAGLLALRPDLSQFMIYNPNPGTPLYERVKAGGTLREHYAQDPARYWHDASGFESLTSHPTMSAAQIEGAQDRCFKTEFARLGPSIYRVADTMLRGWLAHKDSPQPFLRLKAARFAEELRKAYPIFLAGELFGPNSSSRRWVAALRRRVHAEFGRPTASERLLAWAAAGLALWTGLKLRLNAFQHPKLERHAYRLPPEGFAPAWLNERFGQKWEGLSLRAYAAPSRRELLVRLDGILRHAHGAELSARLKAHLEQTRGRLVLDLARVRTMEEAAARELCEKLAAYRSRIAVSLPTGAHAAQFLLLTSLFKTYHGG